MAAAKRNNKNPKVLNDDPFGERYGFVDRTTNRYVPPSTPQSRQAQIFQDRIKNLVPTNEYVKPSRRGFKPASPSDKGAKQVFLEGERVRIPETNSRGQTYGYRTEVQPRTTPFGETQRVVQVRVDPMSGRTVESGTSSMRDAVKRFLRGGLRGGRGARSGPSPIMDVRNLGKNVGGGGGSPTGIGSFEWLPD